MREEGLRSGFASPPFPFAGDGVCMRVSKDLAAPLLSKLPSVPSPARKVSKCFHAGSAKVECSPDVIAAAGPWRPPSVWSYPRDAAQNP